MYKELKRSRKVKSLDIWQDTVQGRNIESYKPRSQWLYHHHILQMNVVVPVLSPQYLRQIQNRDTDETVGCEQRYNRYVYRMLLDQFVDKGSKNYFCRAVCPARYLCEVCEEALL